MRSHTSEWSGIGIHDPLWVAFKHTTGFLIGGLDDNGDGRTTHTYNDGYMVPASQVDDFVKSRDAYNELHNWVCDHGGTNSEKVRDISVTIGPKGSYFARCGTSWISHALPNDLQSVLEKEKDQHSPIQVALGVKGAWILLWSDGTRNWNLRHAYQSLASSDQLLGRDGSLLFAALNPFEENQYFLVDQTGGCNYKTSLSSKEESVLLHEMTSEYMRMRAKTDGTTFSHPFTRDGVKTHVTITPDSYREVGQVRHLMETWMERRTLPVRNDLAFVGAVAGGAGLISKLAGIPSIRAVGVATSTGIGAAFALWYRG